MRRATIGEFVILSILLHMLGILLFGSTTGTRTPGGKAYWGTLAVTLPFPLAAPGIGLRMDRGGDLAMPGTASRKAPERSKDALPRVAPEAPNIVDKPVMPAAEAPAEPKPSEIPLVPTQNLERLAPPRIEREIATPVEVRPSEVPLVPTQTLERIVPQAVTPEIAAPVELKQSEVPLVPTQTLERIVPQAVTPEIAAPVELKQSEVPLVPTQTLERITPAPVTRELAAPPTEMAPAAAAPTQPVPRAVPREVITMPPPGTRSSRTAPPDVVDDPFSSPAASAPARDAPRLDLDAMRQRARDITKEGVGQRAILPFPMPGSAAKKSKEELAIEQAWKPDCKTAYAGAGLLAMLPLMMNAFGEGTCSWNR